MIERANHNIFEVQQKRGAIHSLSQVARVYRRKKNATTFRQGNELRVWIESEVITE